MIVEVYKEYEQKQEVLQSSSKQETIYVIYCNDCCKEVVIDEELCPHFKYVEPQQEKTSTEELLASLMQKAPPLWDHRLSIEERGKTIKDKLWLQVFTEMEGHFASISDMQKKWKNMREYFH
ncbi:unnamed protein product [Psylliodes chrysocephalus]|uniref:MADF domain-containing protein n=1 Tax=Psylliodes chrysocephalus TaxID=3402493 RepID=A0A9P0CVH6_9CUCU|nr:unnamed protein product [Psylliodes chrysocephala]